MKKKICIIGVSDNSLAAVLYGLNNKLQVDVVDYLSTVWSKLQIFEVWRLYHKKHDFGPINAIGVKAFCNRLQELFTVENYDMVIPLNDGAIEILKAVDVKFQNIIAHPHNQVSDLAHNKNKLLDFAQNLGLDVPKSSVVLNLEGFYKIRNKYSYPLVIKPFYSAVVKNDKLIFSKVKVCQSANEAENFLREMLESFPCMVQEKIKGFGVGYTVLADRGQVMLKAAHVRLHEPIKGGASSYRKKVTTEQEYANLENLSKKLVEKSAWSGVLMIEYMKEGVTGKQFLMEFNGRFWGSLFLNSFSGLNFPLAFAEYFLGQKKVFNFVPSRIVYARNVQKDCGWLLKRFVSGSFSLKQKAEFLIFWLWDFRRVLMLEEAWDFFKFSKLDLYILYWLTPLFGISLKVLKYASRRFWLSWLILRKHIFRQNFYKLIKLKNRPKILFVCYGNINRSPFAEKYLQTKAQNLFSVKSSGFHEVVGRIPPLEAERSAKQAGVNVLPFSSKIVSEQEIQEADLVFCFDVKNYLELLARFGRYDKKIIPLGVFMTGFKLDILDPYLKCEQFYKKIFFQISVCLDKIIDMRKNA